MHSIWHEMFKIASVSGAPPQTPLGELTTLPQTPKSWGASCLQQSQLRAFGACSYPNAHVLVGIPASKPPFRLFAPQPPSSGYATDLQQTFLSLVSARFKLFIFYSYL